MNNIMLKSKKGNKITVGELLESLIVSNGKDGLSVKYVNQKPTLTFAHNEQGPLTMITASVCFTMLTSKFAIEKSQAYEVAAWLSSNFSESAPAVTKTQEPEIVPAVSVLDEIKATINLDPKQTKKELLAQLSSIEFLINNK